MTRRPWSEDPAAFNDETAVLSQKEVDALTRETEDAEPEEITLTDASNLVEEALTPEEHDELAARQRPGRPVVAMVFVVALFGSLLLGHAFQQCAANTHSVEAPVR